VARFSTLFLSHRRRRRAVRQRQRTIETVFYGPTPACTPIRVIPADQAPKYLPPRMARCPAPALVFHKLSTGQGADHLPARACYSSRAAASTPCRRLSLSDDRERAVVVDLDQVGRETVGRRWHASGLRRARRRRGRRGGGAHSTNGDAGKLLCPSARRVAPSPSSSGRDASELVGVVRARARCPPGAGRATGREPLVQR
jgi:hypothetical protein